MVFIKQSIPEPMKILKFKCPQCGKKVKVLINGKCTKCGSKKTDVPNTEMEDNEKCS